MRNPRTIAAVLMLATTFCADRAVAPAHPARVEADEVARGFAHRLTISFQRVVPALRLHVDRQEGRAVDSWRPQATQPQALGRVLQQTPFHFRLPPPPVIA